MKKVLITGGSSGLGAAIVNAISNKYDVYYTYYKNPNTDFKGTGIYFDMKDVSSVLSLKEWILENQPDVLINNAISNLDTTHAHKESRESTIDSFSHNIAPTVELTGAFIKKARKRKSGKIINILSAYIIGNTPTGMAKYAAEKNYLLSMNNSWASENINFNVTSNAISPSIMQTNLTKYTDERIIEQMISNHPLKRLLKPSEVADCVKFLIEASSFITGQNITMNSAENL